MEKSIRSPEHAKLCRILRELREEADLRQSDLGARIGEPQRFVSGYERGELRLDLVQLDRITTALGSSLEELLRRYREVTGA
ncbi:helix-turn-helix protein [Haloactinopolyspora alba]|uniref:Helix-turn-helix protein n=1 Tax=Haloactinopolyspora alba TaxID=648780 RepID=A0A2P8E3U3_9ACTN|nr:helix-turn-helix transcriptional regulator [Haloactinopolyspora alba]PSL04145.1 helix-turn-helix protein [Haloactinopolyspora alba]